MSLKTDYDMYILPYLFIRIALENTLYKSKFRRANLIRNIFSRYLSQYFITIRYSFNVSVQTCQLTCMATCKSSRL